MTKVYLVHYDNGESHGDNYTRVDKIFISKELADAYVEKENAIIRTYVPSVTEEKYNSERWIEDTRMTYNEFIQDEWSDWNRFSTAYYYVTENEVIS